MLNYKAIEIFTSEEARYRKKPVADAVMQYIKDLKIAARCIVTRGVAGCYESGEVAKWRPDESSSFLSTCRSGSTSSFLQRKPNVCSAA